MVKGTVSNEYHIYFVELPDGFNEVILPCEDGYTIYLDSRLSEAGIRRSYDHAMEHIRNADFTKSDVQNIENKAHK